MWKAEMTEPRTKEGRTQKAGGTPAGRCPAWCFLGNRHLSHLPCRPCPPMGQTPETVLNASSSLSNGHNHSHSYQPGEPRRQKEFSRVTETGFEGSTPIPRVDVLQMWERVLNQIWKKKKDTVISVFRYYAKLTYPVHHNTTALWFSCFAEVVTDLGDTPKITQLMSDSKITGDK